MRDSVIATMAAAMLATGAAHAQDHAGHGAGVDCSTVRVALPPELAGWGQGGAVMAAKDKAGLAKARLTVGKGVIATLAPTGGVRYVLTPEKPGAPGAPGSRGGLFAFTVKAPGTYRVALGAGVWVDVVKDGKALASTAHGHGPACSGVRKMVDFALTPGRHVLQLAGGTDQALPVMVARLP